MSFSDWLRPTSCSLCEEGKCISRGDETERRGGGGGGNRLQYHKDARFGLSFHKDDVPVISAGTAFLSRCGSHS